MATVAPDLQPVMDMIQTFQHALGLRNRFRLK